MAKKKQKKKPTLPSDSRLEENTQSRRETIFPLVRGTDRRTTCIALLIAALSGCGWFLATPDFDLWPIGWVTTVPLLLLIHQAPTANRAFFYGWVAGIVAQAGGFYWIAELLARFGNMPMPIALLGLFLLAAYQGLISALFALAIWKIRRFTGDVLASPLPFALLAPITIVTLEFLVPVIFPFYLAITQAWVVPVIQLAELTGPTGVTALLFLCSGAIYDIVFTDNQKKIRTGLIAGGIIFAALLFGFIRIAQVESARDKAPKLKIGVVQGNIPFDEKGFENPQLGHAQLQKLQEYSADLERQGAELILWSESSYPYAINRRLRGHNVNEIPMSVRQHRNPRHSFSAPLIFGAVTCNSHPGDPHCFQSSDDPFEDPSYNSAIFIDHENNLQDFFDKNFLLVFGEYTPFAEDFHWLRDLMPKNSWQFKKGERIFPFHLEIRGEKYRIGPMICYEDILPDFNRTLAKFKPHLLVNLTNDAWFGETSEPWEHMALSVFRAVEMRTDLVRAVNTGVSAFIDATGRVYAETYAMDPKSAPRSPHCNVMNDFPIPRRCAPTTLLEEVAMVEGGHSFYATYGDVFAYSCVGATFFLWILWPFWRRKRDKA